MLSACLCLRCKLSRSETWVPKRGGLRPAGKRQESATFLQRSFFDVAVQFFVCCSAAFGPNDFRTAENQCCSATSAAQHSENCSATSVFACGMLQGRGLEGWGLGLADKQVVRGQRPLFSRMPRSSKGEKKERCHALSTGCGSVV